MEQVPKIVRQRLQAITKTDVHPDPDLLAGFAEKLLNRRERSQVLEHLSRCGDCRDVVLLAGGQPDSGSASVPVAGPTFLRWPVLRWGTVAVCAVIVSGAVMLRYENLWRAPSYHRSEPIAASAKPAPQAQISPVPNEKAAANLAVPTAQSRGELDAASRELTQSTQAGNVNGRMIAHYNAEPHAARSRAIDGQPIPAPPPAAADLDQQKPVPQQTGEQLGVTGASPAVSETVTLEAQSGSVTTDLADLTPERAKDAIRPQLREPQQKTKAASPSSSAALAEAGNYKLSARARAEVVSRNAVTLTPRWTLSPDGVLERSLDAGRTWETISVPATSPLRALAAMGPDIWVGGAAGALYHSFDIGQHWMQITPTSDGKRLTADIIGVTFTDAAHGKLTTANDETWTTSDTGQSWQKK